MFGERTTGAQDGIGSRAEGLIESLNDMNWRNLAEVIDQLRDLPELLSGLVETIAELDAKLDKAVTRLEDNGIEVNDI